MYYFIVNDSKEGNVSKIKHILLVPGSFFSVGINEEEAKKHSEQLYPAQVNPSFKSNRIKLRYRPFFEANTIKVSDGYGLYTDWKSHLKNEEENEPEISYTIEQLYNRAA